MEPLPKAGDHPPRAGCQGVCEGEIGVKLLTLWVLIDPRIESGGELCAVVSAGVINILCFLLTFSPY